MARKYDPEALAKALGQYPELEQAIGQLPQLSAISKEDMSWNVSRLAHFHGERSVWHVHRAAGFGSSDMGAIMRTFNPKYKNTTGFGCGYKILEQKLFKRLPDFSNEHMERGTKLESLAAAVFKTKFNAVTDEAAMQRVAQAKPPETLEWLRANPDDIVLIGGKRYLVDYKVPNTVTDEVEFDYEAQLHHLTAVAQAAGVKIDGMLLGKLDLAPEFAQSLVARYEEMPQDMKQKLVQSVVDMDMPGHRMLAVPVAYNQELMSDMLVTGGQVWGECVMMGKVPYPTQQAQELFDPQTIQYVESNLIKYASAKRIVADLDMIADGIGRDLSEFCKLKNINPDKVDWAVKVASLRQKKLDSKTMIATAQQYGAGEADISTEKYSEQLLLAEIQRLGGDPDAQGLKEPVLDAKKAEYFLAEIGVDTLSDEVALRVSHSKKNKEFIDGLTGELNEVIFDAVNTIATPDELPNKPTKKAASKGGPTMG